ncbi:prevent-host-death protein [Novosphingobium sp. PC22D]|uniref:Antitoxin n=2 Tax=Novosphingobium TaxID=165696 RepID=A0ABQ2JT06_9SPHN|nr:MULTISPECIES: prevent-host-death protein [Novosphingobium]MCJ2180169.1 type II toxin-antitoxin system Phd/YefM family antitoxin [Novosphingobium album (ex Hu et al. 2023)]PEQ11031.1 prevent-host-death protein [Novosphingobium sp. PC22D]GGN55613.1 hypothetical protein GCM10011349_32460 [Novosphingobium indicum]
MSSSIETFRSSEVSKRFGFFYDEAMTHPIAVERNGAARVVMLSAAEFERLSRLDHVALAPEELSNEAINAIRNADPVAESYDANKFLD